MSTFLGNVLDVFRPKRWYRNATMVLGVLVAVEILHISLHRLFSIHQILLFALALVSLCLVASGNYGINEILDSKTDARHPQKRLRAIPSGRIGVRPVLIMSIALYVIGIGLILLSGSWPLVTSLLLLLVSGIVYNVPPIRLKDRAYIDFTAEALNNPIRLMVGWYVLAKPSDLVPVSFLLAYWFAGVFLMAAKRFGEIRLFADQKKAAQYRRSLRHYTEERLIMAMIVGLTTCSFMLGILSFKYSIDIVLVLPFFMVWLVWFFKLAFEQDTIVKDPERIFERKGFFAYSLLSGVLFVYLFFSGNQFLHGLK